MTPKVGLAAIRRALKQDWEVRARLLTEKFDVLELAPLELYPQKP